jgi:hypothetical protein
MKKTTATLALVITLSIIFAFGVQSINLTKANPISMPSVPSIQISYPLVSNGGYVNSSVDFTVTVNTFVDSPTVNSISYSLDGGKQVNLSDLSVTTYSDFGPSKLDFREYKAKISLECLSEGNHTLAASASGMSANRSFVVNSNYHITALNVLSPINPIYTSKEVPLKFTYTGEMTNAHYYLYKDGRVVSEKSLSGDISLDNLSDGNYQLLLFVTTQFGQDSKAIYFSVISVPTVVVVATLFILFFSIGLLVYFKKFKKKRALEASAVMTTHVAGILFMRLLNPINPIKPQLTQDRKS